MHKLGYQSKLASKMNKMLLVIFPVILLGNMNSHQWSSQHKADENNIEKNKIELKQHQDDLIMGISRAICYSGYRSGQRPDRENGAINPSWEEVIEDLRILSGNSKFRLIRLYDSGENSEMVLRIIRENKIDIKVMLGIWLKAELSNHESCEWLTDPIPEEILKSNKESNLLEIERGIRLAHQYSDIVVAVNVGNEALVDWNDHKVDTDTIISYVRKVRHAIRQQVTVAENYLWWADHGSTLVPEVDFIAIHVYPIWEGKGIEEAISYTVENVKKVKKAFPHGRIVISEAGWASESSEFGDRSSEENQLQYFTEIMTWTNEMNITTFFFEAFDEDWKGNPDNMQGAEKHWGLYNVDRTPKKVINEFEKQWNN